MNTSHNFYPTGRGGKWHAGSHTGGQIEFHAICDGRIELPDTTTLADRLTYTLEQLGGNACHPIVCRRCAQAIIKHQDEAQRLDEEWIVEGQYSALYGWEVLSHCESEQEADQILSDYRRADPRTPVRRRKVK